MGAWSRRGGSGVEQGGDACVALVRRGEPDKDLCYDC